MISQKKLLLAVLIIIIAISLAGWGVWLWSLRTPINGNTNASNANISNVNTVSNVNNQPIDTSDWQTYRNEELGFEVRYPDGWRVEEVEAGGKKNPYFCTQGTNGFCNQLHIETHINSDQLPLREFYEKYADATGSIINLFGATDKYQKIDFETYEVVKFFNVPGIVSSTIASLNTGDKIVEFVDFGENHQDDGIFDSFVQSFKPIKK